MGLLDGVAATSAEVALPLPGDELLPRADVVMDRAFTVAATPDDVWPWRSSRRRTTSCTPRDEGTPT